MLFQTSPSLISESQKSSRLNVFGIILILGVILPSRTMAGTVSPTLLEQFKTQEKITVIVNMLEGTSEALASLPKDFPDRDARANAVNAALVALAERSQKALKEFCQAEGITFQSMWIDNSGVAENVTLDQAQKLANVEGVKEVREQVVVGTVGSKDA